MSFVTFRTAQRTIASGATTDTYTFTGVNGSLEAIEFLVSSTSLFKVYLTKADKTTAKEYWIGTATETVKVVTSTKLYPAVRGSDSKGAVISTESHTIPLKSIKDSIKVDVTGATAAETWECNFIVDKGD